MDKIPVFITDKKIDTIEKIAAFLENFSDFKIIKTSTDVKDLEKILEKNIQTIILLGPHYTIDDIEKFVSFYKDYLHYLIEIILLAREPSVEFLRKAIKLEIHEVLELPLNTKDLNEYTNRAKNIFKKNPVNNSKSQYKEKKGDNKKAMRIMVFSTKGGTGASFLAANLAVDLTTQTRKDITLVDLNYQFGDIALMLDIYPKNNINDIIPLIDQLDSETLKSFLTIHKSGVKVLPAPIDPSQDESITTESTIKIVNILTEINDFIIFDAPSTFSENVLAILEKLDYLCMITTKDVPSIKNLKISLQVLERLKFPKEKILIIMNRSDSRVGITLNEIEDTIGRKINIAIPSNRIVPLTINKGIPVVLNYPKSSVSKNINKLTKILINTKK
jgi:pilus assembly protein CpaE